MRAEKFMCIFLRVNFLDIPLGLEVKRRVGFTQIDGEEEGKCPIPVYVKSPVFPLSYVFIFFLLGLNRHHDVNGERMEEQCRTVRRAQDSSQSTEKELTQKDA